MVFSPRSLKARHLEILVSRQAGKTEALVATIEFILIYGKAIRKRPVRLGIFAPQHEQAKTDFDRLKEMLDRSQAAGLSGVLAEESNKTTLQLANGSYAYIFPLTSTSNPESKTLDLTIYEEANGISDTLKKRKSDPMGTATNAPEISIGVGGYNVNYFQKRVQGKENIIKANCWDIIAQKRKAFEADGNEWHLNYEQFVNEKLKEWGADDDAFKTQYLLDWVLGTGQFIQEAELMAMLGGVLVKSTDHECAAGIDSAKSPDSTVVTVKDIVDGHLCGWLELHGDNYQDQFDAIQSFFKNFSNIRSVAIDSTGQGDFMPDMFERHTRFRNEKSGLFRVKFSLPMKDQIYKNLISVIRNKQTTIPICDTIEFRKFRQQLLDLQKEYKGELLSCHHPDSNDAHDDYPDSWALCEWAAHMIADRKELKIGFI